MTQIPEQKTTKGQNAAVDESNPEPAPVVSAAGGWANNSGRPLVEYTLTSNELISLSALIAYVANQTNSNEFRVERDLADRFNVANVKFLPSSRFDDAMRYLVDQVPVAA